MAASDLSSMPSRAPAEPVMIGSVIAGLQRFTQCPDKAWRSLLDQVGLTLEDVAKDGALVPLRKGFAAFEAVAAWPGKPNPTLGIDYAKAFEVGGTGAIAFAALNARSIGDALRTISRFIPMVTKTRDCGYVREPAAGSIVWEYAAEGAPRLQFVAWAVALIAVRIAPALPAGWKPHAVVLDADAPRQRAAYDEFFGPGLRFERGPIRLSVQAEHLDWPMPGANPRLHELMTRLAEIEQRQSGTYASAFEGELRAALSRMLRKGKTSATDLSQALGLTPAGFRARLKQHGLDYRVVLDDVRRETARSYLAETDLSIAAIAFALGYTDSSIFTRACQKWFGQSPRDVRNQAMAR